jgi:hypothetical protein
MSAILGVKFQTYLDSGIEICYLSTAELQRDWWKKICELRINLLWNRHRGKAKVKWSVLDYILRSFERNCGPDWVWRRIVMLGKARVSASLLRVHVRVFWRNEQNNFSEKGTTDQFDRILHDYWNPCGVTVDKVRRDRNTEKRVKKVLCSAE